MFSFLKFLNPKSDADKNKTANNLGGKTLNLNSPEARALNIFNKSPISRKSNGINASIRSNCKETVTSPGFSFRVAQRAREMRPTTPNTDDSTSSTYYTFDLNSCNTINSNSTTPRDIYDKKRKLMESLDNFGVRKRTRQECGVDAFVNRRRRTISESNTSDLMTVMNGHSHKSNQLVSTVMSPKSINVENKKVKRLGDFITNMYHSQKKPRTRNNEILSSYSSSKFLSTSGQKRSYPIDNEGDMPKRKHCKSCTCCGSTIANTVLLENDQNNLNKSDKTTETDLTDDLVTVAASRIFNRSGKTQVVRKICMKTILDEVFDDIDPTPYTSIEKVEEKKKKALKNVTLTKQPSDELNAINSNKSSELVTSDSSTVKLKLNEIQTSTTNISPITTSVSSASLIKTPLIQSTTPLSFNINSSECTTKVIEGSTNNNSLQLNLSSPVASVTSSSEINLKQTKEFNEEKATENQSFESTSNTILLNTPTSTIQSSDEHHKLLFKSSKKNESVLNDKSETENHYYSKTDKDKPSFQFTVPVTKSIVTDSSKINENNSPVIQSNSQKNEESFGELVKDSPKLPIFTFGLPKTAADQQSTPVMQFSTPKPDDTQSTPVMQFGTSKNDDKKSIPVMQFGASKLDNKQSTPVMQFGVPKVDDKQSTPVIQFVSSENDKKQSTPVMQFGVSKPDDNQSTPVMQFGVPKIDDKQSTSTIQFTTPKTDNKQLTPSLQFGTTKESENLSTPALFSFSSSQNSNKEIKSNEPVKFQFGSSKSSNTSGNTSSTEIKNVVFGTNNLQNQNLFSFGKTDNAPLATGNLPKYDEITENSTPKLQFGAMPTPVFGTANADQTKPQFSTSVSQSIDNQGPKLVFGSPITDNKSATSASSGLFANNTTKPIFQFNSSNLKLNDKPSETSNTSFSFSSSKTVPTFGSSVPQDFGDKPAFQFNAKKTDESKTQFSTPTFGTQNTTTAPFKFGSNDKPTTFGNTFPSTNQTLQFTNNTEKVAEPFKFGSSVPSSNAFQFNANKNDNGPIKFGQTSNTFSTPGFSGFGNSTPQQTTTFGSISSPQPPFGNMTSPNAAPTFGGVASPSSNTFGTTQGFQFGSTNSVQNNPSTFAFGGNSQPTKPEGAFSFNAAPTTGSPFQFGQAPSSTLPTPQFGVTQPQGSFGFGSPPMAATSMPGSSQPLFSMGAAPAGERRKAKAVRRRQ